MLMDKKIAQIITSLNESSALLAPPLILIEDENVSDELYTRIASLFQEAGFTVVHETSDTLRVLEQGAKKLLYFERGHKLSDPVESLMTEYATGMLSVNDGGGLHVIKFKPTDTTLALVMTRSQVEASYPKLFEYAGNIETL